MTMGYSRNDMVWGFKGHRLGLALWLGYSIRRGFKPYECLQVLFNITSDKTSIIVSTSELITFTSAGSRRLVGRRGCYSVHGHWRQRASTAVPLIPA